jgi:serine/threonine-protein kinase PpkA
MEIPGFAIKKLVAKGGSSSVFLAVQNSLGREVALKILKPVYAPADAERFFKEGRIIAALSHRNVITIYDIGAIRGWYYIAMEFLEGGSLHERIRAGLSVNSALELVETIGESLAFVHQRGVVHRDIKPANILFHADGTPRLTDFGIAKQLSADQELTLDGRALGSPYYLSPEQAQCRTLDGRSDIYSLGILLYEMLTGEKPYAGDSHIETILSHLTEPLPRLPEDLGWLQGLLDRMIAKSPDERFESAQAMVEAVQDLRRRHGTDESVPSRKRLPEGRTLVPERVEGLLSGRLLAPAAGLLLAVGAGIWAFGGWNEDAGGPVADEEAAPGIEVAGADLLPAAPGGVARAVEPNPVVDEKGIGMLVTGEVAASRLAVPGRDTAATGAGGRPGAPEVALISMAFESPVPGPGQAETAAIADTTAGPPTSAPAGERLAEAIGTPAVPNNGAGPDIGAPVDADERGTHADQEAASATESVASGVQTNTVAEITAEPLPPAPAGEDAVTGEIRGSELSLSGVDPGVESSVAAPAPALQAEADSPSAETAADEGGAGGSGGIALADQPANPEGEVGETPQAGSEGDIVPEEQAEPGPVQTDQVAEVPDTDDSSDETDDVQAWLALGDEALDNLRLTVPRDANAYFFYRKVLAVEPENKAARRGISRIADTYVRLAEREISRQDLAKARSYVDRGLRIRPGDEQLAQLDRQIVELQRPPGAPVEEDPVKRFFKRVGSLFDTPPSDAVTDAAANGLAED